MQDRHNIFAYLATLLAIVLLSLFGALVCIQAPVDSEVNLARIIGALAFIGAGVSGLIGVIGTFRPRSTGMSDEMAAGLINKVPPAPEPQPAIIPDGSKSDAAS